jgi:hypothetical protein
VLGLLVAEGRALDNLHLELVADFGHCKQADGLTLSSREALEYLLRLNMELCLNLSCFFQIAHTDLME